MIRTFRSLVVLAVLLLACSPLIDILAPSFVAAIVHGHNQDDTSGLVGSLSGRVATGLSLAALGCFVSAAIGLFRLRRWGRSLALLFCGLALIAFSALGEIIYSGVAFATVQASAAVWGGVVVMAYFSELSGHFQK